MIEDVNYPARGEKTHDLFIAMEEVTRKIYTDQTGRFPHTSSRGMKYIMVINIYDANYVWGVPLKNRSAAEMLQAYKKVYSTLHAVPS